MDSRRLAGAHRHQGRPHGDDARRAIDAGADAIVVSNHGGRQLDGVAPTLRALPEVVAAVNGRIEVLLDGGIRRGSDVVKALALGAPRRAGRPRLRVRAGRRGRTGRPPRDRDPQERRRSAR